MEKHRKMCRLFELVMRLLYRSRSLRKQNRSFPEEEAELFSMPEENFTEESIPDDPVSGNQSFSAEAEDSFIPEEREVFLNPELPELELANRTPGEIFPDFSGPAVNGNNEDLSAVTEPLHEISRILKENLPGQTV